MAIRITSTATRTGGVQAAPSTLAATMRRGALATHLMLIFFVIIAVAPVLLIVMNSFKNRAGVFAGPFALPTADTFSIKGYLDVFSGANFHIYYFNSLVVTLGGTALTIALAALAAFGLSEYKVRITGFLIGFFLLGIMLPIRLGTVTLLEMMVDWGLFNTRTALVLIYTAMSLPIAIAVLLVYFRTVTGEIKDAARIDGAGEFRVFLTVLPVIRPGIAAVAAISMLPIWNDLWFPLVLAPGEEMKTVTLAMQKFTGQFASNWPALLAGLTLAAVPIIVLFTLFSKQFIRGMSEGMGK